MNDGFEITAGEVKTRLKAGKKLFFVNLRHHRDWDLAVTKVRGALRIPDDQVEVHLKEIPRDRATSISVYSTCPGDEPSISVANLLLQRGWNDVHPMVGGFKAYCQEGLPIEETGVGGSVKKIMLPKLSPTGA